MPELIETITISTIALFTLTSPIINYVRQQENTSATSATSAKFNEHIANVSTMEGKFYGYKITNNPHTNIVEVELRMLARTLSEHLTKKIKTHVNSFYDG